MSDIELSENRVAKRQRNYNLSSKRSPNWSAEEVQLLCEFVREHKTRLFSKSEKGSQAHKKRLWEKAARLINGVGNVGRDWNQVRKKWKDLSYYARNIHKDSGESPSNDTAYSSTSSDVSSSAGVTSSGDSQPQVCIKVESDSTWSNEDLLTPIEVPGIEITENVAEKSTADIRIDEVTSQSDCCSVHVTKEVVPANKATRKMSAYEVTRLEIEKERLQVEKSALECLKDISYGLRRVNVNISRLKRRRRSGSYGCRSKRRRAAPIHREETETESSEYEL
uniref:Uncharacterized protein LOC100182713 n=1 Tax=Phallusia mammillata TaxID=59560 RepID=A0A6F9DHS2_9ASCI|nr:uncharacterized protein LOC100182713 [Phallusia mammillata]